MKYMSVLVLLLTVMIFSQGVARPDLSANIMRRVNEANLELDKAEENIRTGRAEHAPKKLKFARQEYENIFNYYKGSFDPNHPTLVKLKNRMDNIESKLTRGANTPTVLNSQNIKTKNELSANILRRINEADIKLEVVNKRAAKSDRAIDDLNAAKSEYNNIFEYYQGSFDPNHSDIIAFKKRIDDAEQAMNAGFAKKNAAVPLESNPAAVEDLPEKTGNDLVDIAMSLYTLEHRLDTASKSSFPGSYVYGVNDDLNIVLGKFKRFNITYEGKFDPNHVAYQQVLNRIERGKKAVSELESKAGSK